MVEPAQRSVHVLRTHRSKRRWKGEDVGKKIQDKTDDIHIDRATEVLFRGP